MISLLFVLAVLALFAVLFAVETSNDPTQPGIKQFGLLTWLMSGNWPAKVGAGLLILGIGALLRYALINIDVAPEAKLGAGLIMSAILGGASFSLRQKQQRRAIHLALAGAAFGVAYLTAYSAYGFFNYINGVNAFALLVLVAAAAGVFAVSSNAISVAILAMAGAYVAPAFSLGNPGPLPVYGYYLAASALSLVMVLMRGWRPLIHLSFLFVLAGGIFFGWSAHYYQPEHYEIMQPLLLALVALHLAMPLVERNNIPSPWLLRFDLGYFICLPIVAAILTLLIAPSWRSEGAIGLATLALIWTFAGAALHSLGRTDAFRHMVVAGLLALGVVLLRVQDVPWMLLALALAIATLRLAPRLGLSRSVEEAACGGALLFAFLHVTGSIMEPVPAQLFLNQIFIERIVAAALLGYGAWIASQRDMGFGKVLGATAIGWAVLAIVAELWRLNIDFVAQLIYGLLLVAAFAAAAFSRRSALPPAVTGFLMAAILMCGWWAVSDARQSFVFAAFVLTAFALLALGWGGSDAARDGGDDSSSVIALAVLPLALLPWANGAADAMDGLSRFAVAIAVVSGALLSMLAASSWLPESRRWAAAQSLHFHAIGIGLIAVTLFHIERGALPIIFEVLVLAYLAMAAAMPSRGPSRTVEPGVVLVIAVTLVLQAMLLRALGPDGVMTIADLARMKLRAVVSLVWVVLGAGLAWWGVKASSRAVWSAGAALLVVAAGKLVLFDFGSLGQLGNILALIAAGLVFLGVAWLAPFPPKPTPVEPKPWSGAKPSTTESRPVTPATAPAQSTTATGEMMGAAPAAALYKEYELTAASNHIGEAAQSATPRHGSSAASRGRDSQNGHWVWIFLALLVFAVMVISFAWREQVRRAEKVEQVRQSAARASQEARAARDLSEILKQSNTAPSKPVDVAKVPVPTPEPIAPPVQPVKIVDACSRFAEQLPEEYVLYAGGEYKGKKLGFTIDQSGHEATGFDVFVNEPGKNVVLALGAYEPSVWNIHFSAGTKIVGVFVSGYHQQAVAGISRATPVLQSTYSTQTPCGRFYLTRENAPQADILMRKIFGRSAQTYFIATDGRIDLGQPSSGPFLQSKDVTVDSHRDKNAPLAGKDGLEQLVREGKLRYATQADIDALNRAKQNAQNANINIVGGSPAATLSTARLSNVYVVLAPMRFPAGLYGAHSATFILAPGVPRPEGNPGHSSVHELSVRR